MGLAGEGAADAEADLEVMAEIPFMQYPEFRPEQESEHIKEAARLIVQVEGPVLVAGGGVTASVAQAETCRLAEMLSIPVATSLNGKGTISEDHRLSVGVVGTYTRKCANEMVAEADLVVFIGRHIGGQVTHSGRFRNRVPEPSRSISTPRKSAVRWTRP